MVVVGGVLISLSGSSQRGRGAVSGVRGAVDGVRGVGSYIFSSGESKLFSEICSLD